MLRNISLAWLTLGDTDALTLVQAAAAAGFGHVGLKVIPNAGSAAPPLTGNTKLLREIKRTLSNEGISVLEMGGVWFTPNIQPGGLKQALETGRELGAKFVIAAAADDCRTRLMENIASMCELAEPIGLKVAIEFIPYSSIASLKDACQAVSAIGWSNCGIVVDALHLARSQTPASELAAVPAQCVYLSHLCDAPRIAPPDLRGESRTRRLLPGMGELPLFDLLDGLPVHVPIEIEAPCAAVAHLPPIERARQVAAATTRFFEAYEGAKQSR